MAVRETGKTESELTRLLMPQRQSDSNSLIIERSELNKCRTKPNT